MDKTIIEVKDNGPYEISGSFDVVDKFGNSFTKDGDVSLCRCGFSDNKPFCDGTHEDIEFKSKERVKDLIEV